MATYLSDSIRDRAVVTTSHEHGEAVRSVAATITVPAGTAIANGDIFKFLRLEAGHTVVSARAIVSDATAAALNADFGWYQVLNNGAAVRSSPATSANGFQNDNATLNTAGIKSFTVASALPFAGPVDVAITVDGAPTTATTTGFSITLILEVVRAGRQQTGARLDRGGY
jgi:hypothetical protein